ncbi:hypothetical protein LG3211_4172 [Lysobacter gummosus]|nr:hypothetical protein LG3211_4172 [Lysobacter gummosus]
MLIAAAGPAAIMEKRVGAKHSAAPFQLPPRLEAKPDHRNTGSTTASGSAA